MTKRRLNIFLWVLGYMIPVLMFASYLLGKTLKDRLIQSLNEQLQVQVRVGQIHYSGLRSFPLIGLDLNNIRVSESFPAYAKDLVSAGNVRVRVNPFRLLGKQKELHSIEISHATIRVFDGVGGNRNYEVLINDEDNATSSLDLNFKRIDLNQCRIVYQNESESMSFNVMTHSLRASGNFSENKFGLKAKLSGLFDHLRLGTNTYLIGKLMGADLDVKVDRELSAYHIEKADLDLEDLKLTTTGDILMIKEKPDLDLQFESKRLNIEGLTSLFPNDIRYKWRDWKSIGRISASGAVKGSIDADNIPVIELDLSMEEVGLKSKEIDIAINNVNFDGHVSNARDGKFSIHGKFREARSRNSHLTCDLSSDDLSSFIHFENILGEVTLSDFSPFFEKHGVEGMTGELRTNLDVRFDYNNDLVLHQRGDFQIDDLAFRWEKIPEVRNATFKGRMNGYDLSDIQFNAVIGDDALLYEGELKDFNGFYGDIRPVFRGDLTFQTLHLDPWFENDDSSQTPSADLDMGYDAHLNVQGSSFFWYNLQMQNVRSRLDLDRDGLSCRNAKYDAWSGRHQSDIKFFVEDEYYVLGVQTTAEDFQLTQLFEEFKNFEQEELTSENISGKTDVDLDLLMKFNASFEAIDREVQSFAKVHVTDGMIREYVPLESLSTFVELEELRSVEFEELQNDIEIRHGIIYLPETDLKNSALNLVISGTHTFQNYMDYHIKIQATELLAKKSKWVQKKQDKRLEEGRDGGLSAYVLMTGTPDDLKFKYDRKAAASEFKENFKKESRSFFKQIKRDIKVEVPTSKDKEKPRWEE